MIIFQRVLDRLLWKVYLLKFILSNFYLNEHVCVYMGVCVHGYMCVCGGSVHVHGCMCV